MWQMDSEIIHEKKKGLRMAKTLRTKQYGVGTSLQTSGLIMEL